MPAPRAASSRRALKNWRVRSRLLLLVAIPTLTAVILGGFRIASAAQSATTYQRVVQLADLSSQTTALVQALQNEREDMIRFIVLGDERWPRPGPFAQRDGGVGQARSSPCWPMTTRPRLSWRARSSNWPAGIGDSYPKQAQQEAGNVVTAIDSLPQLHNASIHSRPSCARGDPGIRQHDQSAARPR